VTVCALRDISSEKRKHVLERVFYHDVLNTAGGIQGMVQFLVENEGETGNDLEGTFETLASLSERLVHEIREHRQLLLAETGELRVYPGVVSSEVILQEVHALLHNHEVARGRNLEIRVSQDIGFETDPDLLRRVLVNMAKNALEATPPGGTAKMVCEDLGEVVAFRVHNSMVMSEEVRLQIFIRSFTTKGGQGHGIGTYSMKLLGERYLGGKVSFISEESKGTTFTLEVPKEWGGSSSAP
jgi:signal transduction histidine kinase